MFLIAMILGFGLSALLLRWGALLEGPAKMSEPAERVVKATIDGKPVHTYISDE